MKQQLRGFLFAVALPSEAKAGGAAVAGAEILAANFTKVNRG
jgi:hypothetical protein